MTLENAKRLYKHYKEIGRTDWAEELVAKRPEIMTDDEEEQEPEKKGKK